MKLVKYFAFIVLAISITLFWVNFLIKKNIDSIADIQKLSPLDLYLSQNYSIGLHLDKKVEAAIAVFCDDVNDEASTSSEAITYSCQNKNPAHKIIIGSATNDKSYMDIVKSIGVQQLFLKNKFDSSNEEGRMICKEWLSVRGYSNVASGVNCLTISEDGIKLYSSIVFLNSKVYQKGKVFIAVMNTLQTSSQEKTETEIIALLSKQKISSLEQVIKFFSFLGKEKTHINSVLEISPKDSLNGEGVDSSKSSNFITLTSGEGIDGEVCNASKITSCYPVYCDSPTAVWGKSIFRCVEPVAPKKEATEGVLCLGNLPVWDGSKCRALVGDIISNNQCLIKVGENSCEMKLVWSADSPQKKVEVRYLGTDAVLSNATSGSLLYVFPFDENPQTVGLFEGDKKINEGKFIAKCESGGFDKISNTCVNPIVLSARVIGEYYENKGKIIFSCASSDAYVVKKLGNNETFATGTYFKEISVPVSASGNYSLFCSKGSYNGSQVARYYNAPPPPPPILSLSLSPQLVSVSGTTTLEWNILYPRSSCSLKAKKYCKSSGCTTEQSDSEKVLNQIFETEDIDQNVQLNPISIQNSLKTVPENTPNDELRTIGKKVVSITETTDFILSCGDGIELKKRMYTRKIQTSQEQ